MRLNVFLSHNGVGSRRKAFELVQSARVSVNDRIVTEPSTEVNAVKDKVSVDGRVIRSQGYSYLILNKPAGYVTTKADPHAEKIVTELLPPKFRTLQPVGRLDKDTEGLLLFTNDGLTAQKLLHPRFEKEKMYRATVEGRITTSEKYKIESGILLEDGVTAPAKVRIERISERSTDCLITIHEGRNRQIRRMFDAIGHPVVKLMRLTFGPLKLGTLRSGGWHTLTDEEIKLLKDL